MAWYTISDIDNLDSPVLVVYPERVKENIRRAVEMTGNAGRLRPHVKTHKSPDATRLLLEAGIRTFKCATIAEAEMLATCAAAYTATGEPTGGVPGTRDGSDVCSLPDGAGVTIDVLLAYQPVGPKLRRFIALVRKYPGSKFSCLTDNPVAARAMAATFDAQGLTIPVYLDLNVGMNRTGIEPGPAALELYRLAAQLPGITPVGLHAYDGHMRDSDFEIRRQKCDAAFESVLSLKAALIKEGFPEPLLIAGGSPSFSIHSTNQDRVCSPGTFIYWDKTYTDLCPEQPFTPAVLVVTRVISLPSPTRLCLDLGHKSIAAENELGRRVHFLNAPELKAISQSEEHLVVEAGAGHTYQPGDILYGLPVHVCPTVALYERAITIEQARVSGEWKNTARDRKLSV